jgi:hypothetical protein
MSAPDPWEDVPVIRIPRGQKTPPASLPARPQPVDVPAGKPVGAPDLRSSMRLPPLQLTTSDIPDRAALDSAASFLQAQIQACTADRLNPQNWSASLKNCGYAFLFPDAPIHTATRPALLCAAKTWKHLIGDRRRDLDGITLATAADWLGEAWPALDTVGQRTPMPDCLRYEWLGVIHMRQRLNRWDVYDAYGRFIDLLTAGLETKPSPTPPAEQAAQTAKAKGKRVDERMLAAIRDNSERMYWSGKQWADALDCAKSTVIESPTWKQTCAPARERARRATGKRIRKKKTR